MKCPCCKGTGELPDPRHKDADKRALRVRMAKSLKDAGYSYRQIQDLLGWKSVRSVSQALEK